MRKLILLTLLIPIVSIGDNGQSKVYQVELLPVNDSGECKYKDTDLNSVEICLTKEEFANKASFDCAITSGHSRTEYSAKKVYESCMKVKGISIQ